MNRAQVLTAVGSATGLPAYPEIAARVEQELQQPNPSSREIARLIASDPALSAALLRVARSAVYAGRGEIETLDEALLRVGLVDLRRMVLARSMRTAFAKVRGIDHDRFWSHSLAVATLVPVVAARGTTQIGTDGLESAVLAGLMHDLGVLALMVAIPEAYGDVCAILAAEGGSSRDTEHRELGTDHAEVGGLLANRWHLPTALSEVIRWHHEPWRAAAPHRTLVQLVHVADFVCSNQGYSRGEGGFPAWFDDASWDALGLDLDSLDELFTLAHLEGDRAMQIASSLVS